MSEKKRRLLTLVPAIGAALAGVSFLIPQSAVSDPIRHAVLGLVVGASIVVLIKLKLATSN